jgi:apolipoprotein N-acyltransferase
MDRKHATRIALLLAVAVIAGLFAAVRTAGLAGASHEAATTALVQARTAQLDRVESALRRQVAAANTALSAARPAATPAAGATRIVYVRPAPIVKVIHRHHEQETADD